MPLSTPMVLEHRQVQVRSRRVPYQVAGRGQPVVLVHGLSGSSRWWRRTLPALIDSYRVYLVDLPGFGTLRRTIGRYSLADAPAWLIAWMRAVEIERAHLVGHSMGGYISLCVASQAPEVVNRLVLAAPTGVPGRRRLTGYVAPLYSTARYAMPRFVPLVLPDALRAGPITLIQAAHQLIREDVRSRLARVTTPTLLIWGEHDHLVPPEHGTLMKQTMPDARLVLLKDAGHVAMEDQPVAFNAALLRFLRG